MPVDRDSLRRAANCYKVQKHLVHYFLHKVGKEKMGQVVDPSTLMDLTISIPALHTKIEIVPSVKDMRLQEDFITLEWNLFVLGNKRMYLGCTSHQDIMNTVNAARRGDELSRLHGIEYGVKPKQIIAFIIRVLGQHTDGYVPWVSQHRSIDQILSPGMLGMGYHHHGGTMGGAIS